MVNRGFCSSVGFKYELDCSCFRRDVQDSVLDSLEGKREGCLRAGSTQRRPVLPSPAPPRRPAVRRPDPTGPWCVRVLDSTKFFTMLWRVCRTLGAWANISVGTKSWQPCPVARPCACTRPARCMSRFCYRHLKIINTCVCGNPLDVFRGTPSTKIVYKPIVQQSI